MALAHLCKPHCPTWLLLSMNTFSEMPPQVHAYLSLFPIFLPFTICNSASFTFSQYFPKIQITDAAHFASQIVYEPKVKYHVGDKPPPKLSDSAFGWLPPLLYVKELLDKVGLDAVAFLRFH